MKHWLYGEDIREHKIDAETACSECVHLDLCKDLSELRDRIPKVCLNHVWSRSDKTGCQACLHILARYDKKQPIPCFLCRHHAPVTQLARVTGS